MTSSAESTAPTLVICGEFNIFTAAAIKDRLVEFIRTADAAEVEISLADVSEIDSAGLQLMVMAKREAAGRGKALRFSGHSAPVLDLIDLCDLAGMFGDPILIRSTL